MVFMHWWTSLIVGTKVTGFSVIQKELYLSNKEFSNLQSIWCLLGGLLKYENSTAPVLQLYPVLCIPRWYCENIQKCDFLYIAYFYSLSMHYFVFLFKYSEVCFVQHSLFNTKESQSLVINWNTISFLSWVFMGCAGACFQNKVHLCGSSLKTPTCARLWFHNN